MLKLDEKTLDYVNKILSMESDFHYLLDKLKEGRGEERFTHVKRGELFMGREALRIDEEAYKKLKGQLDQVFNDYKRIKSIYG